MEGPLLPLLLISGLWSEKARIILLPAHARVSQAQQLLPTTGNGSQIAELPARVLGLKPGRHSEFWTTRKVFSARPSPIYLSLPWIH